jgi:hypothetical protein
MTIPTQILDAAASGPVLPPQYSTPAIPREIMDRVARLGLAEQLPEVVELTREIFGDFEIVISEDPEIPNCSYVSFEVEVAGALEEVSEKRTSWHRRLPRWPTQAPGAFCLGIDIVS